MQQTVAGFAMWSAWQPERNLHFNSFFIERPDGNLAIDPLPLTEADAAEIERRGGLGWIVITNRDHERGARALAERFGAKIAASDGDAPLLSGPVDRQLHDGEAFAGATVIALDGLKSPGEIALHFREQRAIVVGDALWGDPAGSLRLMPDQKLADPARAALSLRRLGARHPLHLLVGDGACIFGGAYEALWACLEARTDVYVNRVNIDELEWLSDPGHGVYEAADGEVDGMIGGAKVGCRVTRIAPGKAYCPLHWHAAEEELFLVLSGTPSLHTLRGVWSLRKGDFIAFPTRSSGAHKIVNDGGETCEIVLIANTSPIEICSYPDSRKVLFDPAGLMLRDHPLLDYFDGE
jgi:uncharacterized cupin superfamily protein